MNELQREPNDLLAYWQRYDWRESFFAPKIFILQALTSAGKTASGAGRDRETAFQRCLGETAELHALAALGQGGQAVDTARIGLAAHVEADRARDGAILEAFERYAVMSWWHGRLPALALPEVWLDEAGLTGFLHEARQGAALKRRTDWWQVDTAPGCPQVMICRSMSPEGQDMLLGFGADPDPVSAARKALRELFLMEMNLMELLASRTVGLSDSLGALREKIATYARNCPHLLPAGEGPSPAAAQHQTDFQNTRDWFGSEIEIRSITPPDGPINVWMCRPLLPHTQPGAQSSTPFI